MQRCQGQRSSLAIAALSPSWASETTVELHAGQAARDQRAQEVGPERLGLGLADVDAEDLAPARLVHAVGDHHALVDHAAAVPDLLGLAIKPQVGVVALERALPERLDLLVEQRADPGHLRARDPEPERLDELVDPPGRDPAHVGLLHDRQQRLLAALARLEQPVREVAASAQLRDLELDRPRARVPLAPAVAVAMRGAVRRRARRGRRRSSSATSSSISSWQTNRTDSRNTSACSSAITCLATCSTVMLLLSAIVVLSLRRLLEQADDHGRRGRRGPASSRIPATETLRRVRPGR